MEIRITRTSPDELKHYGIKGQRWGVRRYQNADGTLTEEGKKRYGSTIEEVERNAEEANAKAKALRLRSDKLNSRILLSNDIKNARAARKAVKAEEKAAEYDEVLKGLKSHLEAEKADNKKAFDSAKEEIRKNGIMSWWKNEVSSGNWGNKFMEHVWDSQKELLDKWWDERYQTKVEDGSWDRLQQKYVKQLASNLGLPQNKETYGYLADWFINGDD